MEYILGKKNKIKQRLESLPRQMSYFKWTSYSCLLMPPSQGHCESQLQYVTACRFKKKKPVDLQFIYILFFGCIFYQNLQNKRNDLNAFCIILYTLSYCG